MQELKADTQVIVTIGPFVDVTDGFTPETGVDVSTADEAELIKHGSTSVVDISGATWAAVTNCDGYYSLTLTTSHTDTEGMMVVVVQDDDVCRPVRQEFMVLSAAAYDSKYGGDDGVVLASAQPNTVAFAAGVTIDNPSGDGLAITSSGGNGDGLSAAGNGTGHGLAATGGATGDGVRATGGATSGDGIEARAAADGFGLYAVGALNSGINATGGTNAHGIVAQGNGSGDGMSAVGGLTGDGLSAIGGFSDGAGIRALAIGGANTTVGIDFDDIAGDISAAQLAADTLAAINAEVVDVLRTDTIPDSVATDGSASTIAQAIYLILQTLTEFAISGTTYTIKKPDGSTTLATLTLDDATNPTSATRAS